MSGGVDSSVACYLLLEQGYDVYGITMQLLDDEKTSKSIKDAKRVCDELGVKHIVIDLREEFKKIVINNFIESYYSGKTPNPCVICNKYFKFGLFYEKVKELGINYIATGHYAKIENKKLKMADSKDKDQSYFLYGINKDILDSIIFPLSDFSDKNKVREIANKLSLTTKDKKDSQEICFIPEDNYKKYLLDNSNKGTKPGNICLKDGTVLGKHNGIINYTIGQRKGLGISHNEPLYVIGLNIEKNEVIVGKNSDLYKDKLIASNINMFDFKLPEVVFAKIRSRAKPVPAKATIDNDKLIVEFMEAQRAITRGQSVVIYDKDGFCLGGGIIEKIQ